jgi:hypothetical protein
MNKICNMDELRWASLKIQWTEKLTKESGRKLNAIQGMESGDTKVIAKTIAQQASLVRRAALNPGHGDRSTC